MNKEDLRIVFMGTPEFAVASLDAFVQNGFTIVGVITAPDKPAGRGMQLQESAVKKYAVTKGLKVLQPEKLKNDAFLQELKNLAANLQIVVAFRMLPEIVWNMPEYGTINVHGSLLPQYRGAAPINWAVIHGEKETGVTTFKLKHEIDTGNILLQAKMPIHETDTAGTIHDAMMHLGAATLVATLEKLLENKLVEQPQQLTVATKHAPKIFKETCAIDWNNTTESIYNKIRGLSPYPTAYASLQNKTLKIFTCTKEIVVHREVIGSFSTDLKTYLKFATTDGYIHCTEIQLEGKKRMNVTDFLRGYKF